MTRLLLEKFLCVRQPMEHGAKAFEQRAAAAHHSDNGSSGQILHRPIQGAGCVVMCCLLVQCQDIRSDHYLDIDELMLEFVTTIAREAGMLLRSGFRGDRQLDFKSRTELVTDMDLQSERLLVARIAERFPDHQIVTEEGGGRDQASRSVWVIDPLDGTNNYAHGVPFYAVSIALLVDDAIQLGVVYDPTHDECFSATADGRVLLDGQPIQVSPIQELRYAQLSTGFAYDRWSGAPTNLPEMQALMMECQSIRCMGSAALDLCYVAAGRSDGYWELHLNAWDSAAGALIVQMAGGRVTTTTGGAYSPWTADVAATNGLVHGALLDVLSRARTEPV
jgi:myo-inositol-1(or 4)-monophosphatase